MKSDDVDRMIKMRRATRDEKIVNPGVYEVPVHASDMSEKHVHISDKDRHEFDCPRCGHCCRDRLERLCRIMGTFDLATGHADTIDEALDALESELRDVLGHLRARREWIGLDPEMMRNTTIEFNRGALWAERYLKEKNYK